MKLPDYYVDDNCHYLVQDLKGLDTYERAKAIVNFCDKETKQFEKRIDNEILKIFESNGINIPNTDKNVLKRAFDILKSIGKEIEIVDVFDRHLCDNCKVIKKTKTFTIIMEDDYLLQCGVLVKEIKKENYHNVCWN